MMRTVLIWLFWIALLLGLTWQGWQWVAQQLPDEPTATRVPQNLLDEARKSPGFSAVVDRGLSYPLPDRATLLRLLSNAGLAAGQTAAETQRWDYALEYQWLAADSTVLEQGLYHFQTKLSRHQQVAANSGPANFYLQHPTQPLDGRVLTLQPLPGATHLRVRLAEADPAIDHVLLRAFYRETVQERNPAKVWQRLHKRERRDLARHLLYPPELLSASEQRNLLSNIWKALGPAGIEGRDFRKRTLYSLDAVNAPQQDPQPPEGLEFGGSLKGMASIPEPGGTVTITTRPLEPPDPAASDLPPVELRWYGHAPTARKTLQIAWRDGEARFRHNLEPGLIELTSPLPAVARLTLEHAGESRDITPTGTVLRTYRVDAQQALAYRVEHVGQQPTALRFDLRTPLPQATNDSVQVRYNLLNEQGGIVQDGVLLIPTTLSVYDSRADAAPVSEPARYYFSLPVAVQRIRFLTEQPVLISAYTRPSGQPKVLRVAAPRQPAAEPEEFLPSWFLVRPIEHSWLLQQQRSELLRIQPRPPQVNQDLELGRYRWQAIRPTGLWRSRYLLAPRDPALKLSEQALSGFFRRLPTGRSVTLSLQGTLRQLRPRLIYIQGKQRPVKLTLSVNGRRFHTATLRARQGQVQLPPLSAGRHTVRAEVNGPLNLYLSNQAGHQDGFVRRSAYVLDGEGLTFPYRKQEQGREVLSARLYTPVGESALSRVQVRIQGADTVQLAGPLTGWSFRERVYDIDPDHSLTIPVLDTPGEQTDAGQPFFIPLDSDLPPGDYRIDIQRLSGPGRYLSLGRLIPGLHERRTFGREKSYLDVFIQ